MTAPRIGRDCHITLSHPDVENGAPYGFLVDPSNRLRPAGFSLRRQALSDGNMQVWAYFDVLLGDHLINPDGSHHTATRSEMYTRLMQYLTLPSGLALSGPLGAFSNLGALGFISDERHRPDGSLVRCQLNNIGVYWPPVAPELLVESVWDGAALTWNSTYWR
jgi:hypothetical protein